MLWGRWPWSWWVVAKHRIFGNNKVINKVIKMSFPRFSFIIMSVVFDCWIVPSLPLHLLETSPPLVLCALIYIRSLLRMYLEIMDAAHRTSVPCYFACPLVQEASPRSCFRLPLGSCPVCAWRGLPTANAQLYATPPTPLTCGTVASQSGFATPGFSSFFSITIYMQYLVLVSGVCHSG